MRSARSHLDAELRSAKKPTADQIRRLNLFLTRKYGREVPMTWEKDESIKTGFRLQVGSDVYDWTLNGTICAIRKLARTISFP